MTARVRSDIAVGDEFEVDVLRIAHGGHCIAHHAGWTLFVRHAIPGERVRARVTEITRKIVRADAIAVLRASPDRVPTACHWSGPDGCGGCDFTHIDVEAQRQLKSEVLISSLIRFGGIDESDEILRQAVVQALPGSPDGLAWRTRVSWATQIDGSVGLRRHRSHDIVPVDRCAIAAPDVATPPPDRSVQGAGVGEVDETPITRLVRDRTWTLPDGAFWQVHPALPEALVTAVLELGRPEPRETWWDLYAGAGLVTAFLGEAVGEHGRVEGVEWDASAVAAADVALADLTQVTMHSGDVSAWVARQEPGGVAGIVLDPPRSGAGPDLAARLGSIRPRRIVYIACDPVALARDVKVLTASGFTLASLVAFDAFPMTHHFETVALLTAADQPDFTSGHALS